MKKIYSELSRIQQELKAPKNLYNSFGKYSYRNAEGILESVKPLLNGLVLIINDEPVVIGDRIYIKATVTLTDGDESVSAVAYAREDETKKGMDGCQITGACSSYARKYALNALLMIDDAKDSDDDSLSPKNPKNSNSTLDIKPTEERPFTPPPRAERVEVTVSSSVGETTVEAAFKANMDTFMEAFGITDSGNALKVFNGYRESLQDGGVLPKVKKLRTVQEVNDTFDAIYKNFKPSGDQQ